jgi:signal transduction histidine kinase
MDLVNLPEEYLLPINGKHGIDNCTTDKFKTMSTETFINMDELNLRNVCEHLSKFGSFVYMWKTPSSKDIITSAEGYKFFGIDQPNPVFTNDDLEKIIHPEDINNVREVEKKLLEKEEGTVVEFRFFCPDGTQKYVRQSQQLIMSGKEAKILIILQDITEQKRAEIILNIMNEAFFELDNHFVFRRVNLQAELFFKKQHKELVGESIWDIFPEAIGSPLYDMIIATQKEKIAERNEILFPANGRWIRASIASYADGIIVVFHDINEQKKTDEELKNLNESLKKKNKELEQKNDELTLFSYITSNDLKAPLRKIYTSFEMILTREGFLLSNNAKAHFRRIQASIQKINLITDDLLSFARVNKNDEILSETDLNEILNEAKEKLKQNTEKKFIIESGKLPVIEGYPELLLQLFLHIISNGIKFQEKDNIPRIHIRHEIIYAGNAPGKTSVQEYHRISFEDNGIGFDVTHAEEIFNLFYRLHTTKEFKGTGVGLAICKKIMERHGGFIEAKSEGNGSTFICNFPV